MRIRLDEIPESGRFVHLHWAQDRLRQFLPPDDPFEMKLVRPVNVDLEIQKRADHIRVEGTIRGLLELACHRCLDPVQHQLDEAVDLFLIEEVPPAEEDETELELEDLEYEFFDGEAIEVDQLIVEQIFLSLPHKVLCSEQCRGLCPRCGANLNTEPCNCAREDSLTPFAKLKALRDALPDKKSD
ncbi:MAG: DUF177 domain-containing protein [Syntrophobacteraceae bacterium]